MNKLSAISAQQSAVKACRFCEGVDEPETVEFLELKATVYSCPFCGREFWRRRI